MFVQAVPLINFVLNPNTIKDAVTTDSHSRFDLVWHTRHRPSSTTLTYTSTSERLLTIITDWQS